MPERSGSKLQDYIDNLAAGMSVIRSRLSKAVHSIAEMLAAFTSQLSENMVAFTAQIILSESALIDLVRKLIRNKKFVPI